MTGCSIRRRSNRILLLRRVISWLALSELYWLRVRCACSFSTSVINLSLMVLYSLSRVMCAIMDKKLCSVYQER
ncbi:Uncharacterised protein [Vibrio cholerae]|nr:Uncharacterised protein [Vibrio cholerae]